MTDDVLERMLQPFFTTKPDGLGMGLAIARRLVEAHEGSLSFRRNSPHGLTATARLPMARAPRRRSHHPDPWTKVQ